MKIRLALTLTFERKARQAESDDDFEHRDNDTAIEVAMPAPVGFSSVLPDDKRF